MLEVTRDVQDYCEKTLKVRKRELLEKGSRASDSDKFPIHCESTVNKQVLLLLRDWLVEEGNKVWTFEEAQSAVFKKFPFCPWTGKGQGLQRDSSALHCLTQLWLIGMIDRAKERNKNVYRFSSKLREWGMERFLKESGCFVNVTSILDRGLGL